MSIKRLPKWPDFVKYQLYASLKRSMSKGSVVYPCNGQRLPLILGTFENVLIERYECIIFMIDAFIKFHCRRNRRNITAQGIILWQTRIKLHIN
ncbi:hypothetical protein CFR78_12285 [Komagataeibacter rhaeticus]|nr:hypothetical protein GLUCORHAEAF1_17480 [Komagataeibacter rhaeticus AF1]PYD52952.1 hypothetical protein CFR78_12285 [Komagataeibacter rhaeticus]